MQITRLSSSVEKLMKAALVTVNHYRNRPESVVTIADFVERHYFPFVNEQKRPSTVKTYTAMWKSYLKPRCGDVVLCDIKTQDVQNWLKAVATETGR